MDDKFYRKLQLWAAWCGILYCVIYGGTVIIYPHNVPPPDPTFTAQELVDNFYLKYQSQILLGQSLSVATGILFLPWAVQMTLLMWKREPIPLLALIQLGGGILTTWVSMQPPVMWAWCAENAGIVSPELIKMNHFQGWYFFNMTYWATTIEYIAIFIFVMKDKQKPAIMPKWCAWLALLTGLAFIPETMLPYHKTGIFAINGYWNFHTAFLMFFIFTGASSIYMIKNIKKVKIAAAPGIGQAIGRSQF
ncbi:hypothetical protein [Epilithonimonas hungarica]|uniref:Uncharacterized protein n=1 Tax=Epilithonimonas hungarica TaxID=454006 RepID=A0A1G7SCW3_9FLAO|nr:hypothetical protein [Epilithonimonas hungarica]SDG20823.1 hypothetical protein SAMN05421825_2940 [Epilithonimonas hungarica]